MVQEVHGAVLQCLTVLGPGQASMRGGTGSGHLCAIREQTVLGLRLCAAASRDAQQIGCNQCGHLVLVSCLAGEALHHSVLW